MKTLTELKYIAIVSEDRSGPAYGIGRTEHQARTNAANYGFLFRDGIAVEISEWQYNAVLAGNPDGWALEPDKPAAHFYFDGQECRNGDLVTAGRLGQCRVIDITDGALDVKNAFTGETFYVCACDCDLLERGKATE